MKLTGKAKEEFLDFYWETKLKPLKMTICKKEDLEAFFDTISELFQNAIIIEFFDSVGLRIGIAYFNVGKGYFEYRIHYNGIVGIGTTRPKATNTAIEKANIIYNESKL